MVLLTFGKMEPSRYEVIDFCKIWLKLDLDIRSSDC